MNIRLAENSDIESIALLLPSLGYSISDANAFRETWAEVLGSSHMGIYVALINETIVGYLAFSYKPQLRMSGRVLEIDELVVSDEFKGKGVGTHLIKSIISKSQELFVKRIVVSTNKKRESYARGFYQKHGFQEKDSALLALTV